MRKWCKIFLMSGHTAWRTGMKVEDFETLVECCNFYLNEDEKLQFVPYSIKDNKRVAKINQYRALQDKSR